MKAAKALYTTAFLCACSIGGALAQNTEQLFEIVTDCDILAAHPNDPLRVAPGIPDETMVPRLAATACEAALQGAYAGPRHAFQLGRALLELDQRDRAIQMFEQAASQGSALAYVYLGDARQFGWVGPPDGVGALQMYQAARDQGLLVADEAIAQVTFDETIFSTGAMLKVLADRQVALATDFAQNIYARSYLYAFALELSGRCGSFLQPDLVGALENYRFPEGWSAASEEGNRLIGQQDTLATYDIEILVDRHGCSGTVIETIADSFNQMLRRLSGA